MIVARLGHLTEQSVPIPALRKAVAFLQWAAVQTPLPEHRIDIDDVAAYAQVQAYETLCGGDWEFEGHRRYLDLHYVVTGEEIIGCTDSERVQVTIPYDVSTDAWLGKAPLAEVTPVRLMAGQAILLFPTDAHAPRRAASHPTLVLKIVVKIGIPGVSD